MLYNPPVGLCAGPVKRCHPLNEEGEREGGGRREEGGGREGERREERGGREEGERREERGGREEGERREGSDRWACSTSLTFKLTSCTKFTGT